MSRLLCIETATQICSVSISDNGALVAIKESSTANSHSEMLSTFIEEIVKEAKVSLTELDAIVVSMGPGSYTGLRIGVSSAKGLCYALDKPLIAISTLQSMAFGMAKRIDDKEALFCPMIDARRMEVYASLFNAKNEEIREVKAEIIDEDSFKTQLNTNTIYFAGDGAEKCKEMLSVNENANFMDDFVISSKDMIEMATSKYKHKDFVDLAYFEPYYLKDFIAGKPSVKGLK